jgi:hypothetical protein
MDALYLNVFEQPASRAFLSILEASSPTVIGTARFWQ